MRPGVLGAIALVTSACDDLFGLDPLPLPDAAIQPGDLALAYAFEDPLNGAMVLDGSGNGNTATLFGPVFEDAHYGRGLTFDGFDDHAVASNSPSINIAGSGLTVAAWVRVDVAATSSDAVLFGKLWEPLGSFAEPFYQYGLEYDLETNSFAFILPDAAGVTQRVFLLGGVSGGFQHIAFTYDGTTVRGYIDGVELFTTSAQGTIPMRDTQLVIGVDGARGQALRGQLDNLHIYRRALDAGEIAADRQVTP